jgi:hypothetical protein
MAIWYEEYLADLHPDYPSTRNPVVKHATTGHSPQWLLDYSRVLHKRGASSCPLHLAIRCNDTIERSCHRIPFAEVVVDHVVAVAVAVAVVVV